MKALPDLNDAAAMAARGRRSVLMSARNEAAEALRDATVAVQRADFDEIEQHAREAIKAGERLVEVANLWSAQK